MIARPCCGAVLEPRAGPAATDFRPLRNRDIRTTKWRPALPSCCASIAGAIFLSAALLFAVQPMFTKMVLPRLGGTPSVWSVAMVFFQAVLLAGYAYAHALTRYLPGKRSIVVHLAVMCVATLFLPLAIAPWWGRPPADATAALWLLGLFAVSIGVPFFALSANGPLLQAWFARTDHPAAANPYFLYAASNIGSFLALLSYPFVARAAHHARPAALGWAVLFVALIALIAWCGCADAAHRRAPTKPSAEDVARARADLAQAARWIVLAAVPSALLISVTAHISTDIAAAPFMWVIPLALYLVTFVIVFQTRPILPHDWMVAIEPLFIVALAGVMVFDIRSYLFGMLALNVVAFFVITHGVPRRAEPQPARRAASHRLLHVDVGGRRDRRHFRRPDRAERLLLGAGISGADRARDPVPAGPRDCRPICARGCSGPAPSRSSPSWRFPA